MDGVSILCSHADCFYAIRTNVQALYCFQSYATVWAASRGEADTPRSHFNLMQSYRLLRQWHTTTTFCAWCSIAYLAVFVCCNYSVLLIFHQYLPPVVLLIGLFLLSHISHLQSTLYCVYLHFIHNTKLYTFAWTASTKHKEILFFIGKMLHVRANWVNLRL